MKKPIYLILIFSIYLLSLSESIAQRIWTGELITISGSSGYFIEECADTTISDTTWIQFLQRYKVTDSFDQGQTALVAEIDNKVYLRAEDYFPGTLLLYDYTLAVNDTFYLTHGLFNGKFVVTNVDSTDVLGFMRKRLQLSHVDAGFADEWIQGIGSTMNNFFSPGQAPNTPDFGSSLSCFKLNPSSATYFVLDSHRCFIDEFELVCNYITSHDQLQPKLNTLIYPNPSNGAFYINHFETIDRFIIYSIDGNIMAEESTNQSELDISNFVQGLTAGIYFVLVQSATSTSMHNFVKL